MELPYQKQAQQLAHTAKNKTEVNLEKSISDESCQRSLKTLVNFSVNDESSFSWCIQNELRSALACLDILENKFTDVSTIPSTTHTYVEGKEEETIDLEQKDLDNCQNDEVFSPCKSNSTPSSCIDNEKHIKTDKNENYSCNLSVSIKELMERIQASERNVLDIQQENGILRQSLEASVLENEGLKEENEKFKRNLKSTDDEKKILQDELIKVKDTDVHQDCNDKIAALRSVARALECENALLLDQIKFIGSKSTSDKNGVSADASQEVKLKDLEIKDLTERYEKKKNENIKLMDQIIAIEQELETERIFGKNVMTRLSDVQETLDAVKHGKRSVELNLQFIVEQNETLQKKVYNMDIEMSSLTEKNVKLEEQVNDHTSTTGALSTATDNLEQEIAMQASFYEDKIECMQREMNDRLEEMSVSQVGDAESVRVKYVDLFDEKANELHELRKTYEKQNIKLQEVEQRLADQELMEQENKEKMKKSQKCHNEELSNSLNAVQGEITTLQTGTSEMEQELQSLRKRYDDLQLSYLNAIAHFKSRLCKVAKNEEESGDSIQLSSQGDVNEEPKENLDSPTDSSDKNTTGELHSPLSSGDDCPTSDSTCQDNSNYSPTETADEDDDSGIKVETSETNSNPKDEENLPTQNANISMFNSVGVNGCSNNLSDTDQTIRELKSAASKCESKRDTFGKCNNKSRKARRKRR